MSQSTNKSSELSRDVGKILEIVSGLSQDVVELKRNVVKLEEKVDANHKELTARIDGLDSRMGNLDGRMDELTNVVTAVLDWNKEQDKRLDRVEITLQLPKLQIT